MSLIEFHHHRIDPHNPPPKKQQKAKTKKSTKKNALDNIAAITETHENKLIKHVQTLTHTGFNIKLNAAASNGQIYVDAQKTKLNKQSKQ